MTTPEIRAIGYCVNYDDAGERAFEFALGLAQRNGLQLNIFHFVDDPYQPGPLKKPSPQELVDIEKKMRLHYDARLGDYLDVGFRLCESNEWTELHRCLCKKEFQLLVLAMPQKDATFGRRSLVRFADDFVCPVVLVGPCAEETLIYNEPARLIAYRLGINTETLRRTHDPQLALNLPG